jgi:succinate dehydrogenase / fumarate reductase, cytochrome b subunit
MTDVTKSRPLSPHLQIYKPIPTMVMSIMHRITGGALYVGTVLVAWWLIATASGAAYYDWVNWLFGTLIGNTWVLVHHMLGGIRHLIWDLGYGYEKHFATKVAKAMLAASVTLTLLLWVIGFLAR